MQVEVLELLAVKELIHRYSDAITRRDFDCVATFFADTAVWEAAAPFEIRLEGAAIAPSLKAALASYDIIVQASMNPVIDVDGDRARGRTTIYEMGRDTTSDNGFFQFGVYDDVMERQQGAWRFVSRHFHPVYREDELPGAFFRLNLPT